MHTNVLLSVGGSNFAQPEINTSFLLDLRRIIRRLVSDTGMHFSLVCGGGHPARLYQEACRTLNEAVTREENALDFELDLIGIAACTLNSQLLRFLFRDLKESVSVNPCPALYTPGASSDRASILTAQKTNANLVINITNVDYVFTADPHKDKTAQPITTTTWRTLMDKGIIKLQWTPGMSTVFDGQAAKIAMENNIAVATINGAVLDRIVACVYKRAFTGTLITP